jgi:hypothetical protein
MSSDDDTQMVDLDFTSSVSKGKGKAVQIDHPADNDNLPW